MKPKPFRIFRVGTHTDSAGGQTTFTAEQLAATVQAYNEGEWRAPMVVGHPKGTAPAYGWVGKLSLSAEGDVLVDSVDKLNPDFAELMKSGAYRNRSASWYSPDHPNNPTPGVWQLRHLGMLGAQPPALKGLGDVEFGDQDGITVEFGDFTTSTIAGLFRRLRDSMIGKWGVEEADKAIPGFLVEDLEADGRRAIENPVPSFSDPEASDMTLTPEQIAQLQADAARATQLQADLDAANAARTAAEAQVASFSEQQRTAARAAAIVENTAILQPLVQQGRLLPTQVAAVADFMAGLDDTAKVIEFGDATGENALTARGLLVQIIATGAKQVEYSEVTGAVELPGSMKPEDLAAKAREYQEAQAGKGITITSTQAVNAVLAGKAG